MNVGNSDWELDQLLNSCALLVVDDDPDIRDFLKQSLESSCALFATAASAEDAEALRLRYQFDILLVDIRLPGLSGLEWIQHLRERGVRTHVIYMTAHAELDMLIAALRNGADDFILKPFGSEHVRESLHRTLTRGKVPRENALLQLQMSQLQDGVGLIGRSACVKAMINEAQQLATSDSCIVINGEAGTGKDLLARTLHKMSRRQGALMSVNCSSAEADTSEHGLSDMHALFDSAHKGSLLLRNVDQLSPQRQATLFGLLDTGSASLSTHTTPHDVRVIATTRADLRLCADRGTFRRDLLGHLNALQIRVPAMRERYLDLKELVELFMHRFSVSHDREPVELLHTEWQLLSNYHWPGNVRELRNIVEQTVLLGRLPIQSLAEREIRHESAQRGYPLNYDLNTVERAHIEAVLESVGNNKSAAARILRVSRKTLERKQALWHGDQ